MPFNLELFFLNHSSVLISRIFELIKRDTLKKMGKLSKEATIQKALLKAKFIRDSEIPMPQYDPTALDEMPLPKLSDLTNGEANAQSKSHCPNSMVHCRLGCVCDSVNCQDMYDEYYEKHCRDTGDPECMYGCICENPGPHILNGESKWITSKPYKYKRPRVRVRKSVSIHSNSVTVPWIHFSNSWSRGTLRVRLETGERSI